MAYYEKNYFNYTEVYVMSKSKKQNKVETVVENTEVMEQETGEVEVKAPKENLGTKLVAGAKKHGKKVAGIAVGIGVGVLGYALGKKFANGKSDDDDGVVYYDYAGDDYAAEGVEN